MLSEAAKKFWGCPELMENLLSFLDTFSIISLAKAHKPVLDIILGKTVWNKLVNKICHDMAWYQVKHSCLKSIRLFNGRNTLY